jgi:hypothetical protein
MQLSDGGVSPRAHRRGAGDPMPHLDEHAQQHEGRQDPEDLRHR